MATDTSERGLEDLIVRAMTGRTELYSEPPAEAVAPVAEGTGWLLGDARHYDRGASVDVVQLRAFLQATQPALEAAFSLGADDPTRRAFLARVEKKVGKRGVVDVLRKGIDHGAHHVDLFYGTGARSRAISRSARAPIAPSSPSPASTTSAAAK